MRYSSSSCAGTGTQVGNAIIQLGTCHKLAGNPYHSFKVTWGAAKATGKRPNYVFREQWTGGVCNAAGKLYSSLEFGAIDTCHRSGNASSIKWTKGGEGIDAKVTEKIYSTAADCTGTPSSTNKFSIVDNSCSTKQQCWGSGNNQYCESIAAKYKMSAPGATSSATAISALASVNILVMFSVLFI